MFSRCLNTDLNRCRAEAPFSCKEGKLGQLGKNIFGYYFLKPPAQHATRIKVMLKFNQNLCRAQLNAPGRNCVVKFPASYKRKPEVRSPLESDPCKYMRQRDKDALG